MLLCLIAIAPAPAFAADDCPSEPRIVTLQGTITTPHGGNWENAPFVAFQSFPCEEYRVTFEASYAGQQPAAPNFWIGLANSNNVTFAPYVIAFSMTTSGQLPVTPDYGDPFPGTLHPSGNIAMIKVFTTNSFVPVDWSITITTTPRPSYNRGSLTMASAPLVHDGDTLDLSLRWTYPNFYKVMLKPGGTLSVTGTATNDWTGYSAELIIFVWDNAFQYRGWIAVTDIAPQTTNGLTGLTTYTNTRPQTEAAYLQFQAGSSGRPADLAAINVQVHAQEAKLTLFLDADGNFNPASPTSDDAQFRPGSQLSNGASVSLPQAVEVIAAFVDATGTIVQPLPNQDAVFSLEEVSAFEGIAMNASDPRGDEFLPDLVLQSGSPVSFGGDKTARMSLSVWDYAARGEVVATVADSRAELALPKDLNRNGIPDNGWVTFDQTPVSDTSGSVAADVDPAPYGEDQNGNEKPGDGLGVIQEYRGLIVGGYHRRTDPAKKDLFIYSSHLQGIGNAATLPVVLHLIEATEMSGTTDKLINHRYHSGVVDYPDLRTTDTPTVITRQRALWVTSAAVNPSYPDAVGLTDGGVFGPDTVNGAIEIYDSNIRQFSPSHSDPSTPDLVDAEKTNQTLAHEIGHGIGMPDWKKDTSGDGSPGHENRCNSIPLFPTRALTVMISCWFAPTQNANDPKWTNIPHSYDQTDLNRLRLKR
jgi:hypothetical protein